MRFVIFITLISACLCGSPEDWSSRTIYFMLTDRFAQTGGQGGGGCDNWHDYCGGTFQGMRSRLDYIQGMGFDAIWITPPIKNTAGGYHGYWAQDIYQINDRLGGATELMNLVNDAHSRGMLVMVGVVANHVGPVGTDYSQISPFNSSDYYHPVCQVSQYTCFTNEVLTCRLADLPDLNQDNSFVAQQLQAWINDLVNTYSFDGVRADTVMYVASDFWKKFRASAGVYLVGEVFSDLNCNIQYVSQEAVDGTLDYPNAFNLRNLFGGQQSLKGLGGVLDNWSHFPQSGRYQGTFLDNHDNPRFLNAYAYKYTQLKNAIVWMMFSNGIPIIYYGTEQGFNGGNDPNNREPLWSSNYDQNSILYTFLNYTINARQNLKPWAYSFQTKYSSDQVYAWQKGNTVIVVTNQDYTQQITVGGLSISSGTVLYDQIGSGFKTTVQNGQVSVTLPGGRPLVLAPDSPPSNDRCAVTNRNDCGFSGVTQSTCEAKGCCWSPTAPSTQAWCYYASNSR